jgi:two-component system phosphate regulon response regulator PhoB
MAKVLIVEDETDLQQVLKFNFQQAGYEVLVTSSGSDGIRVAREEHPDLVLLDVMLPDILGTEVCRLIKSDPVTAGTPVMMLTAKGEEHDRVQGFERGADDYITKPFSVRELLLRVNAVLRRTRAQTPDEGSITFGRLRIDQDAHRAWVDEQEIELSALEFRLLLALYERRNRLREKLGSARGYIETVRGVGYRFVSLPDDAKSND